MSEVEAAVEPVAAADDAAQQAPRYRSGAVAKMLRMPVATLRVWERRYQVSQPQLSHSGQRLYSAAQVQRLAQLKQLTDLGHAIGSLARLDLAQLREVVDTHARTLSQTAGASVAAATLGAGPVLPPAPAPMASRASAAAAAAAVSGGSPASAPAATPAPEPASRGRSLGARGAAPPPPWRVVVVGKLLGQRLKGAVQQALTPPGRLLHVQGPFETLEAAAAEPLAATADALLVYAASLQDDWLDQLLAQMPGWRDKPIAVLYGFASERSCRLLGRTPGLSLLRGPQSDAALAQWLRGWRQQIDALVAPGVPSATPSALPVPPRRWDDAALASFAGLSTTIACECPRHLADLLVQLSHFEAYSADCEHRSPEDAELHAYLRQVTALARAQFETALERVARHEGLIPPA